MLQPGDQCLDSLLILLQSLAEVVAVRATDLQPEVGQVLFEDLLEKAGFLKQTGTRPKGKRHEALYLPTASRFEYDTSSGEDAITSAVKLMATGFRMAERDLEAALRSDNPAMGGPDRNFYAFRLHVRASPELLKKINEHMNAVLDLISPSEKTSSEFGPDDQHVSLTLALLPIKGRDVREP